MRGHRTASSEILLNILVNARIVFPTHEFNSRFLYKMSMNVIMLNVHVYIIKNTISEKSTGYTYFSIGSWISQ